MSFTTQAQVDALRSIAYSSITDAYSSTVTLAPFLSYPARIICFTNTTDGDMVLSTDGVTDQVLVPAGSFKLFDVTTNHRPHNQDDFCFAAGTLFYIRYLTSASKGSVYIEVIYAQPAGTPSNGY